MASIQFRGPDRCVLVAVKLDEHASTLIKWGVDLALRTGLSLELMNVTEPHPGYFAPYGIGMMQDLVMALESEAIEQARSRLRILAEEYGNDLKPKIHVCSGYAPQVIMEQSIRSHADLIVVGAATGSHRFIPKGFSTALTLLAEAPVPVLVIPFGTQAKLVSGRNKIIFADDLSTRTESATVVGLRLAASLGQIDFYHLHVNGLTTEVLEASIATASASAHLQTNSLDVKELQAHVTTLLGQKLKDRVGGCKDFLEVKEGKYIPTLKHGDVQAELGEMVKKLQPALLVFGRHRTFHLRSFIIGHVPFYAMMEFKTPLIMLPEDKY